MRVIGLGVTCNNACVFCAQGELFARAPEPRDVSALVSSVERGAVIALQGGEPTLREDLPAIVRALAERGARKIVLQTNGRRFAYRAYARALREASGALSLDVSLHGSTEAMHDYHTQTPGSFRQTVIGMRHARSEGIEFGVTTVVTRSNYRHLGEIVSVAAGLGARAVHFAPAENLGRASRAFDRAGAPAELVRPHLGRAIAEATRSRLGFVVGDRASEPAVRELFAGLGEVEPAAPLSTADRGAGGIEPRGASPAPPSRARLPVMGPSSSSRHIAWER
jgi:MoaA/NifB/PqqE/SkfB family radical SAM enzyme